MNKDELLDFIEGNKFGLDDLLELSFHKDRQVAFRSAWKLEYYMVNEPREFVERLPAFFKLFPGVENQSAMRHYTKIVALLTDRKANSLYKVVLSEFDFEPIIEKLFTWLVDDEVLVASKVHCMQSLANLSPRYDWIKDELLQTINHLEQIESIAFFARAKVVKKTLKKQSAK
ncbi:MAG: hypothetical protein EOO92_06750 [Pedobacter sp.]|nr:MAG: hypothetical protein EOO92_06750 [Pedobacter sp.]